MNPIEVIEFKLNVIAVTDEMKETLIDTLKESSIIFKEKIQNASYFCFWNPEKKFDFWEAQNFAKSLKYAGISNWEIPDLGYIDVLHYLRDCFMIEIPENFKSKKFWSSTESVMTIGSAYCSSFSGWHLRSLDSFKIKHSIILVSHKGDVH